jgi:hypothetical protein
VFNEAFKSVDEKEKERNAMLGSISNFGGGVTLNYEKNRAYEQTAGREK